MGHLKSKPLRHGPEKPAHLMSAGDCFNWMLIFTCGTVAYMKKVTEKMKAKGADESQIKAFQSGAQNYYTKKIAPNFRDFDFYAGESMDTDGMVVLLNYREDGITPYVTIWKYGLTEEKV